MPAEARVDMERMCRPSFSSTDDVSSGDAADPEEAIRGRPPPEALEIDGGVKTLRELVEDEGSWGGL